MRVGVVALVGLCAGCDSVFGVAAPIDGPLAIDGPLGGGFLLRFDGVDDLVTLARRIQDDFTIELWIRTTRGTAKTQWHDGVGLVYADAPSAANDFGVSIVEERVGFGIGSPDVTLRSTIAVTTGNWYHVAATRERATGELTLYLDGELQEQRTHGNLASLDDQMTLTLGHSTSSGAGTSNFYLGDLDELRLWNVARSQAAIRTTLHRRLDGDEDGLAGYYRCDEGMGLELEDSSRSNTRASLGIGDPSRAPAWIESDIPID